MAAFTQHIAHVKATIPSGQLLVFEAGKNTYAELAAFLCVELPPRKGLPASQLAGRVRRPDQRADGRGRGRGLGATAGPGLRRSHCVRQPQGEGRLSAAVVQRACRLHLNPPLGWGPLLERGSHLAAFVFLFILFLSIRFNEWLAAARHEVLRHQKVNSSWWKVKPHRRDAALQAPMRPAGPQTVTSVSGPCGNAPNIWPRAGRRRAMGRSTPGALLCNAGAAPGRKGAVT